MGSRLDITLMQLESFIAAASCESISAAAEQLHTSQSNLSVAVANLERRLGVELLVRRRSKGVGVTPAGRDLLVRARAIVEASRELEDAARGGREELEGDLQVGCHLPLTSFYVPGLIAGVRDRAPGVRPSIREGNQDELQQAVHDGELDLALVYDQSLPTRLRFHRFASVWPYAIVAPGTAIAARGTTSLAELSTLTMVNYEAVYAAGRSHELFRSAGLPLPAEIRARSLDSVRALVAADLGFSILNQRWGTNLTADGAEVVPVELTDRVSPMGIGVLTRRSALSAKTALAIEILRAHAVHRHPEHDPLGEPLA
ncbi:LysR family transcriptional regulator [Leucobacter sp. CSA1]|uniref:LysR family transcriptional regulator n=1 Tax=Leucobacter chromiisoli TaxID=2796471 RepID=A0A934Q941_9MICO|nr:LysR substrate-binding domain-containing protein [Leucobacter chromiisoli]MBK0420023.1 LysR family transcriptional regulator [Leucobacter chromiisoli]